jgi:hypothetical protein
MSSTTGSWRGWLNLLQFTRDRRRRIAYEAECEGDSGDFLCARAVGQGLRGSCEIAGRARHKTHLSPTTSFAGSLVTSQNEGLEWILHHHDSTFAFTFTFLMAIRPSSANTIAIFPTRAQAPFAADLF